MNTIKTHESVFASFLKKEDNFCPWNTPGVGVRSQNGQLTVFGYGWDGLVIAYWEGEKVRVVRGSFQEMTFREIGPKARTSFMKYAKENKNPVYWGEYSIILNEGAKYEDISYPEPEHDGSIWYLTIVNGMAFSIATPSDRFEAAFEEFYNKSVEGE